MCICIMYTYVGTMVIDYEKELLFYQWTTCVVAMAIIMAYLEGLVQKHYEKMK